MAASFSTAGKQLPSLMPAAGGKGLVALAHFWHQKMLLEDEFLCEYYLKLCYYKQEKHLIFGIQDVMLACNPGQDKA